MTEAPNPTIPGVNKELLEKVRSECKTLRLQDKKFRDRTVLPWVIMLTGMTIFAILVSISPKDSTKIYYDVSSWIAFLGTSAIAMVLYYTRAYKYKLKPNERWALLTLKVYENLTANGDPKQVIAETTAAFAKLIKDIRREWDLKENARYNLGYLINTGLKFIDRLDMIALQISGEAHHRAEAQLHLINITNFFLHPSEEEFQKILTTKMLTTVTATFTDRFKTLSKSKDSPWFKRLRIAGFFAAGAVATFFISMYVIGIGKDTAYAVAAAVGLSYFVYEFKRK